MTEPPRPEPTVADLERWEAAGASWRARELAGGAVVVELCACTGETVDELVAHSPEVAAWVARRGGCSDGPGTPS